MFSNVPLHKIESMQELPEQTETDADTALS